MATETDKNIIKRLEDATNGAVKIVYGRDAFKFKEDLLNDADLNTPILGLLEKRGGGTMMALGTYACDYRLFCVARSEAWADETPEPLALTKETARVLCAYLRNIRPMIARDVPSAFTAVHDSDCVGHYCDVSLIIETRKCRL